MESSRQNFQPMNANCGLMRELGSGAGGRQKKIEMGMGALAAIDDWIARNGLEPPREPQAEAKLRRCPHTDRDRDRRRGIPASESNTARVIVGLIRGCVRSRR